jgi:uncharacterized protein YdaU (DUF1376 family)
MTRVADSKINWAARKKNLSPFPIRVLNENIGWSSLSAAQCGALFNLLLHFWMHHCEELPENQWKRVSRISLNQWNNFARFLKAVFPAMCRELEKEYAYLEYKRKADDKGRATRKLRALEKKSSHPVVAADFKPTKQHQEPAWKPQLKRRVWGP